MEHFIAARDAGGVTRYTDWFEIGNRASQHQWLWKIYISRLWESGSNSTHLSRNFTTNIQTLFPSKSTSIKFTAVWWAGSLIWSSISRIYFPSWMAETNKLFKAKSFLIKWAKSFHSNHDHAHICAILFISTLGDYLLQSVCRSFCRCHGIFLFSLKVRCQKLCPHVWGIARRLAAHS